MYDYNDVSIDDVVKFLFEAKKDKHAQRVMRLTEELKLLEGKLEAHYENRTPTLNQDKE